MRSDFRVVFLVPLAGQLATLLLPYGKKGKVREVGRLATYFP